MASHIPGVIKMTVEDKIGIHMAPENIVTEARASYHG
jgi:hypothetical protein